jgi:membrane protein
LGEHRRALAELYGYLSQTAGRSAASGIESIVTATFAQRRAGLFAQIFGWAIFIIGAVGLFGSLQDALNTMWDVAPAKQGLLRTIRDRFLSFAMVLAIAFLLLASVVLNSALTMAAAPLAHLFPALPTLLKVADFALSAGLITVLFATIYRVLPDCPIAWRDVWLGAAISALLFVLGQFLLGWYLGRTGVSSSYGAFGGIVIFLIWVNYSAQIMLFGAEFTHVYARARSAP